jgi:hypothetical protein
MKRGDLLFRSSPSFFSSFSGRCRCEGTYPTIQNDATLPIKVRGAGTRTAAHHTNDPLPALVRPPSSSPTSREARKAPIRGGFCSHSMGRRKGNRSTRASSSTFASPPSSTSSWRGREGRKGLYRGGAGCGGTWASAASSLVSLVAVASLIFIFLASSRQYQAAAPYAPPSHHGMPTTLFARFPGLPT